MHNDSSESSVPFVGPYGGFVFKNHVMMSDISSCDEYAEMGHFRKYTLCR